MYEFGLFAMLVVAAWSIVELAYRTVHGRPSPQCRLIIRWWKGLL
jgi:hypothetical protein